MSVGGIAEAAPNIAAPARPTVSRPSITRARAPLRAESALLTSALELVQAYAVSCLPQRLPSPHGSPTHGRNLRTRVSLPPCAQALTRGGACPETFCHAVPRCIGIDRRSARSRVPRHGVAAERRR